MLYGIPSAFTINPVLLGIPPYDPNDLVPISRTTSVVVVVAVHTGVPVGFLGELARLADAEPGKLLWGAAPGLPRYAFTAFLKRRGLDMPYVPYKDVATPAVDLGEGRVHESHRRDASSGAPTMNSYIFDNSAEAETAERFASLDSLYNFRTFQYLETAGIGPGWHCLEVGGGSGAIAAWMADRVGPSGYVLVTDLDPRFMEGSVDRTPAQMELRRHDIGTDPLPEQAFDLVHARLVLQHVPQRHQAFARLVAALKPRGWLVIEEFDGRLIDRTIPMADASEAERFRKMGRAVGRLLDDRGYEADWPRRLYCHLKTAGLTEVSMEGHVAVREGGDPGTSLDAANYAQVRKEAVAKGMITDAEVDAVLARLDASDFAVFSPVMFTAWGRRPGAAAAGATVTHP